MKLGQVLGQLTIVHHADLVDLAVEDEVDNGEGVAGQEFGALQLFV